MEIFEQTMSFAENNMQRIPFCTFSNKRFVYRTFKTKNKRSVHQLTNILHAKNMREIGLPCARWATKRFRRGSKRASAFALAGVAVRRPVGNERSREANDPPCTHGVVAVRPIRKQTSKFHGFVPSPSIRVFTRCTLFKKDKKANGFQWGHWWIPEGKK